MEWNEIKVETATEAVEAVSNILLEAGAKGVAIEDEWDFVNLQDDGFGQIKEERELPGEDSPVYVLAYYPNNETFQDTVLYIRGQLKQLEKFDLKIGKNELKINQVKEEDWENSWKAYFHPIRITRYLTIVPFWEDYTPADERELLIQLDPGMAFGTGTHPTTRLSLEALEAVMRGGEKIIAVGTGSGVLSIAAKAMGAKTVHAYDIDEIATRVSKENIAYNAYAADVIVKENNLLVGIENQEADIIVANILAEILVKLIPDAWDNLKDDGYFILSGIIDTKRDELLEALYSQGFEVEQTKQMKDWVCLICKKATED
jgi:ribosomal protein L11 methyltransferase